MKTPEEKIILMMPTLLKTIQKTLPMVNNRYLAKELKMIATKIAIEVKQIPNIKNTN
jgi:hypothetical protein